MSASYLFLQGLCNEGRLTHGKTPATKAHKILTSNAQRPPLRKPVSCATHGNAVELVCAHESHVPRLVCNACVAQTHGGHACQSISDYFEEKCKLAQQFVAQVKMQQGAEKEEIYKKV